MTDFFFALLLSRIENSKERQVLAELYTKHRHTVKKYITKHLKVNEEDIEDCVQQCYLNVTRNISTVVDLEPNYQLAYLLTTARTTTQQFLLKRKEIIFSDLGDDDLEKQVYNSKEYATPSAEFVTMERELLLKFHDRLSELSPTEQAVFDLYILGKTDRETLAKQLCISPDSVRTYISRTTRHAQKILKEVCRLE